MFESLQETWKCEARIRYRRLPVVLQIYFKSHLVFHKIYEISVNCVGFSNRVENSLPTMGVITAP